MTARLTCDKWLEELRWWFPLAGLSGHGRWQRLQSWHGLFGFRRNLWNCFKSCLRWRWSDCWHRNDDGRWWRRTFNDSWRRGRLRRRQSDWFTFRRQFRNVFGCQVTPRVQKILVERRLQVGIRVIIRKYNNPFLNLRGEKTIKRIHNVINSSLLWNRRCKIRFGSCSFRSFLRRWMSNFRLDWRNGGVIYGACDRNSGKIDHKVGLAIAAVVLKYDDWKVEWKYRLKIVCLEKPSAIKAYQMQNLGIKFGNE